MRLLERHGWRLEHVRGSHHILRKEGRHLSVPIHAGRDVGKGLLARLLKEAGIEMTRRRRRQPVVETDAGGYYARIKRQRQGGYLVEFPDLQGCVTEGETVHDALKNAREALSGWLFVAIKHGDTIPGGRVRRGRDYHHVVPDLDVTIPLAVLSARKRRGLTQRQVAVALGISQQAYRKLEVPGKSNPTLKTLERLGGVLGLELLLKAA